MSFFSDNMILVSLIPLWICMVILSGIFFKITNNNKITFFITFISTFICLIFSLGTLNYINISNQQLIEYQIEWLNIGNIHLYLGTLCDSASIFILSTTLLIMLITQLYIYKCMKDIKDFNICFLNLNFLSFAISSAILAPNLFQFFISQIFIAISLYFLHTDKNMQNSTFMTLNAIADTLLFIGLIILSYFSSVYMDFHQNEFLSFSNMENFNTQMFGLTYPNVYALIIFIILVPIFIKSIQFPFQHVLSKTNSLYQTSLALISAIFSILIPTLFLIRISPCFSKEILSFILFLGIITAISSSLIAIAQKNINKVLIYLLSSQTGIILMLIALGSNYSAIIYAIVSSFTFCLLFFTADKVIKYFRTDNTEEISGFKNIDYRHSLFWLIGSLSLSGLFGGGFTIKQITFNTIKASSDNIALIAFVIVLFLNSYCVFINHFKIFYGEIKSVSQKLEKNSFIAIEILCLFVLLPGLLFNYKTIKLVNFIILLLCVMGVLSSFFDYRNNRILLKGNLYKILNNELYFNQITDYITNILSKLVLSFNYFDNHVLNKLSNIAIKTANFKVRNDSFKEFNKLIFLLIYILILFTVSLLFYSLLLRS